MAREFARQGRNLALCARRGESLEQLEDEILTHYPDVRTVTRVLDVNDHAAVFAAFHELRQELGSLDRIIVNAGIGLGNTLGTGHFAANRQTLETNLLGALAQCEAALEIFREQGAGHLVTISSISALRGMRGHMTAYAASKAALFALTEGISLDLLGQRQIVATVILPGYIRTPLTERHRSAPFIVNAEVGCTKLVRAIEREPARAHVPAWPWAPIGMLLRVCPLPLLARLS
jgi:NAD(P)-dependent dehydrogenase (short-subunit alcohol dehydrogenase family)